MRTALFAVQRRLASVEGKLLSSAEAAEGLGISVATLYDWLAQSRRGSFVIRGQPITIDYHQGGRRGQGRIMIDAAEVERLLAAMRVRSLVVKQRQPSLPVYPGITVPLGRPSST